MLWFSTLVASVMSVALFVLPVQGLAERIPVEVRALQLQMATVQAAKHEMEIAANIPVPVQGLAERIPVEVLIDFRDSVALATKANAQLEEVRRMEALVNTTRLLRLGAEPKLQKAKEAVKLAAGIVEKDSLSVVLYSKGALKAAEAEYGAVAKPKSFLKPGQRKSEALQAGVVKDVFALKEAVHLAKKDVDALEDVVRLLKGVDTGRFEACTQLVDDTITRRWTKEMAELSNLCAAVEEATTHFATICEKVPLEAVARHHDAILLKSKSEARSALELARRKFYDVINPLAKDVVEIAEDTSIVEAKEKLQQEASDTEKQKKKVWVEASEASNGEARGSTMYVKPIKAEAKARNVYRAANAANAAATDVVDHAKQAKKSLIQDLVKYRKAERWLARFVDSKFT